MADGFLQLLSAKRLGEPMQGHASFSQGSIYSEEAFRFLLNSESKRSKRSGHSYQVLLISQINEQGVVVRIESGIANTVILALSRSLRETDYIGWYRQGYAVGGVLTVVGRESAAEVSDRLQARLRDTLRSELGVQRSSSLRIRMCEAREFEGVESGGASVAVN